MRLWGALFLAVLMAGVVSIAQPPSRAVARDYDCSDFSNQAEAEEYLLPGDPYGLDADGDGIACEDLPCPCASSAGGEEEEGGDPSEHKPIHQKPYRLKKAAARHAAHAVARKFARANPKVTTAAVGKCRRLAQRRVDCAAVDRGRTSVDRTTCYLQIAVRAVNRQPRARLQSARCRTVSTLRLTMARARMALRSRAAELAGKTVAIRSTERSAANAVRGLAEWTRPGSSSSEACFALMEAVLGTDREIRVSVIESACEPSPAP